MKPHEHLLHIFTPRHTNNHRAKILHFSGLTFCIALLLVFQLALTFVHAVDPEVLGYASNINVSDLLSQTNSRRAQAGVGALALNDQLTNAASGKGADMFQNQYWAHVSPSGKEPWAFITGAGYNYVFAGENLARDFGDSKGVVDAWMNSPSHKENLLNERFKDVGFAIVNGKYGDSETTLVVQMFGSKASDAPSISEVAAVNTPIPSETPTLTPTTTITPVAPVNPANGQPPTGVVLRTETQITNPKFDILSLSKTLAFGITMLLLAALVIDAVLIYKRKTVRISGHNIAHMLILITVLVAVTLIGRGIII